MMEEYAQDCWCRSVTAFAAARMLSGAAPDDSASRAYYAAFHAVSALFATQGVTFVKHAAVRAAVHRDLVRTGKWPTELGEAYDLLWQLRTVGDYGGSQHVTFAVAADAVEAAERIMKAVHVDERA